MLEGGGSDRLQVSDLVERPPPWPDLSLRLISALVATTSTVRGGRPLQASRPSPQETGPEEARDEMIQCQTEPSGGILILPYLFPELPPDSPSLVLSPPTILET